jgi:hypothetical protein
MRSQHTFFSSAQSAALDRVVKSYPKKITAQVVKPHGMTLDQFIKGVVKWLNFANTPYQSRTDADNHLHGLFYPQDFKTAIPDIGSAYPLIGLCHSDYWDVTKSRQLLLFEASKSHTPSEALTAFFQGPTFTDCGSVLQACIFKSIEEMIGTEAFNHVFAAAMTPFLITNKLFSKIPTAAEEPSLSSEKRMARGNPLFFLFDEVPWDSTTTVTPGDLLYLAGVDKYREKHYTGAAAGWNVICLPNIVPTCVYLGFGPSEFKQPLTVNEIRTLLINAYNQDQSEDTLAAHTEAMADRPDDNMLSVLIRQFPFMNTEKLAHDKVAADYEYVCHKGSISRLNINKLKAFVAARLRSEDHLKAIDGLTDYIPYDANVAEIAQQRASLTPTRA